MGRCPKDITRSVLKGIRWTADNWAEVEAAAKSAGLSTSAFIRGCVLSQTREINGKLSKLKGIGK
jgi:Mobilization protein NikA